MLVCFVLLRFRLLDAFVEAGALRSIVLRYAGAPTATVHVYFFPFFPFCLFGEDVAFSEYFLYDFRFSWCVESTPYVLSFRMVFFYLVTSTGWIFDVSYVRNHSINQSMEITIHVPRAVIGIT